MEILSGDVANILSILKSEIMPVKEKIKSLYVFITNYDQNAEISPEIVEEWHKIKDDSRYYIQPEPWNFINDRLEKTSLTDKNIWNIKIEHSDNITFMLGAGASVASGIPTVKDLLSDLWKRARKIGREDLDRLINWCNKKQISNIEDILTAAYIAEFSAKNRSLSSLLKYFILPSDSVSTTYESESRYEKFTKIEKIDVSSISFLQDTLQTLFGLLTSTMISAEPNDVHKSIADFIKSHKNCSIITTNYDCCMDMAILGSNMIIRNSIRTSLEDSSKEDINLIKMHGSIDWSYCDSCQDVKDYDLLKMKDIYDKDILSYPVLGICKKCEGLRRPLLVPPLSFKFLMFPNLINIWNNARVEIEKSDYLIIIGYSFSEADTYITKIISHSMSHNQNQKMIIVNTDANLVVNLRNRFSARIDNFDEGRILKSCENCDKILPKILNSLLGKKEK